MLKANALRVLALAAVLLVAGAAWASADLLEPEPAQYYGHAYVDFATGDVTWNSAQPSPFAGTDIYSNVASAINFSFSSTSLTSIWGDRVTTAGTGILSEQDFTVFNPQTSAGSLASATFNLAFFDAVSLASLGGYTTGLVSFGSGLPAGSYAVITTTGLGPANINLNVNDVLVTQQVGVKNGLANRLGIASLDPPTIGSSSNVMYVNSATVGPAGYYNIGIPALNANPGYRLNVTAPVPTQARSWGSVKADYR